MLRRGVGFFLFNHYSHATYLDHGEIIYSPSPVRSPRGGGTLQFPPALRPGLSRGDVVRTKEITKERTSCSLSPSTGTRLPTSVEAKKSSTARLHLSSARRSRIFHRSFHLPVSLRTSVHRIFCCGFHFGHALKRCARVWFGYRPPTLRGGPILRPVEVLPGQAVPRLELVEPRG